MYNEKMRSKVTNSFMLWLTAYLTLIGVAAGTLIGRMDDPLFFPILLIYILIGIEMAFLDKVNSLSSAIFYFTVITITISCLHFLNVPSGLFLVLFFVISAQAMMNLPGIWGYIWIFLLAAISAVSFIDSEGIQDAQLIFLVYGGGYLFFGIFGKALIDATEAKEHSGQLYDELQNTHAQLQESVQRMEELAVTRERNRLAREMHDSIGHRLTVSAVQLEGAQRLVEVDPGKSAAMIGIVREQVREALAELRSTVTALRRPIELDLPVDQALERLVESFEAAADLRVHLSITDMGMVPERYKHAVYRIVQESLTNVQRHAGADQAWVIVSFNNDIISLIIRDNGIGFPEKPTKSGFGLRGIMERATLAGGECSFENRSAGGAVVSINLPVEGAIFND